MCEKALFTQFSAKTNEICVNKPVLHILYEAPSHPVMTNKGYKYGSSEAD